MRAEFDETLVTGNELIDSQHKELIERINLLLKSCEDAQGKVKAVKMLDYLLDYTEFHFSAEEKLQEEISYPGLKEHREKHEEFKSAVKELQEMLEEEYSVYRHIVMEADLQDERYLYQSGTGDQAFIRCHGRRTSGRYRRHQSEDHG